MVLVSEPAEIRREFALEHGATLVFNPTREAIPIAVRKAVPPGVHVALDAAGVQASLDSCLSSLRPRGTYLNVALWRTTANVDMITVLSKELLGLITYTKKFFSFSRKGNLAILKA